MFEYKAISSDDGEFEIRVLVKEGQYVMPSLNLWQNHEIDCQEIWDNVDFILNEFYPWLRDEKDPQYDYWGDQFSEYIDELIEMIDRARYLGYWDNIPPLKRSLKEHKERKEKERNKKHNFLMNECNNRWEHTVKKMGKNDFDFYIDTYTREKHPYTIDEAYEISSGV